VHLKKGEKRERERSFSTILVGIQAIRIRQKQEQDLFGDRREAETGGGSLGGQKGDRRANLCQQSMPHEYVFH